MKTVLPLELFITNVRLTGNSNSKDIKQFLAFIGITDVTLVALDQLMFKAEEKMQNAGAFIGQIKS